MDKTILIAEDDKDIVALLKLFLENEGFAVVATEDGEEAIEALENNEIDIAVVDLMMPKMNGYEFIKKMRQSYNIPVIILSAQNQDSDKIIGLEIGADDYMTKPFNPLEIIARVKSHLRRYYQLNDPKESGEETIQWGELRLNTSTFEVFSKKEKILLTPMEFKLLKVFMENPQRIYTKAQLYEMVTGDIGDNEERAITVHISNLREKIGSEYIETVRGLGYKLEKK
ncbi:MAG: response regulator transcription factor [Anaerovoracaceae bacterium]